MSTAPIAQGPVDVNVRGWMPIDTAPKGWHIEVLLYDGKKGGVSIGAWWPEETGWLRSPGCARLKPSHWMSLPEAPNAKVSGVPPQD